VREHRPAAVLCSILVALAALTAAGRAAPRAPDGTPGTVVPARMPHPGDSGIAGPPETTSMEGPGLGPVAFLAPARTAAQPSSKSTAPEARPLRPSDLKGLAFRSVGPANMGGRVSAIALAPGDGKTFYVGYATGGVFKTVNLGTTFTSVFDEQPLLSIGAIAVADAPVGWRGWEAEQAAGRVEEDADLDKEGRARIVWVGTGEGNGRNSSSWGGGVYRSTDAGGTFTYTGLAETHDIPRLAVDPRDPDTCYVAALGHLWGANPERGVYKTSDGGKTWQQVLKVDENTGACDVVVDPESPDTIYAAMYARRRTRWSFTGNSDTGGIFRSDDAGKTWKKLTRGLPPRTGRIGLAIDPGDPNRLFASVESDYGGAGKDSFADFSPSGGLFRSDDRGESWTRLTDLNPRPFYFSRVALDPEDPDRVYLPGWDLGISDDGGVTFRRSGSQFVHVDFHAIVVDPDDTDHILVGNDGGIYQSHDRARTWDYLNTMAVGQFYRVAVDMSDPYRLGGGLQDNGTWIGPSETSTETDDSRKDGILNSDWRMIYFGDGFGLAFDPEDPNVVYATSQGGELGRVHLDTNVRTPLKPAAREGEERLRFNWDAPFTISRHDPSVLYLGGNRLFKLTDRGDRWFPISGDLTRDEPDRTATVGSDAETYGTIVSLSESPLRQGLLWVGTDDGLIQVTEDEGSSWKNVTPGAVDRRYVSYMTASQHDPRTAYAAVDGHRSDVFEPVLLVTRDLGATWTEIESDLPAGGPVKTVIEDPGSPDVLYCGTEFGLYVSLDRGGSWVRMNGDTLPPAIVSDLVFHPREKDLIVATHGRSLYIFDDASMFAQLTPEVRSKKFALLKPRAAHPRLYFDAHYGVGDGIFKAKNPAMGAYINYWLSAATGDPVTIRIADPSGLVIRELSGPGMPGLNRVIWDLQADPKHRYRRPEEGMGQTQFVPAGTYEVTASFGDEKAETTVEVLPAPNASKGM
jgi:photosystem II stability/assembly factor-like uncharacterized protein